MDPLPLDAQHVERRASAAGDAKSEATPIKPAAARDANDFIRAMNCEALTSDIHSITTISSDFITQTRGMTGQDFAHEGIAIEAFGLVCNWPMIPGLIDSRCFAQLSLRRSAATIINMNRTNEQKIIRSAFDLNKIP